jgi:hypothetical protein
MGLLGLLAMMLLLSAADCSLCRGEKSSGTLANPSARIATTVKASAMPKGAGRGGATIASILAYLLIDAPR